MFKKANEAIDKFLDKHSWVPLASVLALAGVAFGVLPAMGINLRPPEKMTFSFNAAVKDGQTVPVSTDVYYYGNQTCAMATLPSASDRITKNMTSEEFAASVRKDDAMDLRKQVRAVLNEVTAQDPQCRNKGDGVFAYNFWYNLK